METHEIVSQLADGLNSGTLLPPQIQAKVLHEDRRFHFDDNDLGVDLLVEFTINRHKIITAIECKSRLTSASVKNLPYSLHQTRVNRRAADLRNAKSMIAAPYISEPLRSQLRQIGVGYIDLNGTFFLDDEEGIYIDIAKGKGRYGTPQGTKNIFIGKSRRLVRVLLCHPYTPFRLEDLAKQTQLSVAQVFQIFQRLEEYEVIDRSSAGRQLTKPRKLLNLFSAGIKNDYQNNRVIFNGFYEGKHLDEFTRDVVKYCEMHDGNYAFTLFSGLEPQQRNVIENVVAVYVSGDPARIASSLRLPFTGVGANVLLMRPPERDNTSSGGVFYEPRALSSGVKAVNLIQEYLDFSMYPGRGEEQARFLLDEFLGFRE